MINRIARHKVPQAIAFWALALVAGLAMATAQAGTINWGDARTAVADAPYGGVVAGPPDDSTGGFDFSTGAFTKYGSDADIVIGNNGTIGATGIALSKVDFSGTSEAEPTSYLTYLRARNVGDTYVIKLKNGKHAKLRIDKLTAGSAWYTYSKIEFSYRLEQSDDANSNNNGTNGTSSATYFVYCERAALPGGLNCAPASKMESPLTNSDVVYTMNQFGCVSLTNGVYYCSANTAVPGYIITYVYSGTTNVSRIIYIH